jgi:hypothetical protein
MNRRELFGFACGGIVTSKAEAMPLAGERIPDPAPAHQRCDRTINVVINITAPANFKLTPRQCAQRFLAAARRNQ